MSEKRFNSRIVHKHAVEEDWLKATGFIPMQGELIVYDIDAQHTYERFKIGDGTRNVKALPFVDDAIRDTLEKLINAVDDKVDAVSALVGDETVADQIADANIIHVGPTAPENPNVQVWINTAEEGTGIIPVLPRIATITLTKAGWTGSAAPYSQVVSINTVTSATRVELNPTVAQILSLQNEDIALMANNDGGVVTIYSFGGKPSADMTMQATLTEVSFL